MIGLFEGMFEKNILTFNPRWDENAENTESFIDVRDLQKELKKKGIQLKEEADETTEGPAYITLEDPDGNPILIDQHRLFLYIFVFYNSSGNDCRLWEEKVK